jgi:hypothetical protein
MPIDKAGAHVIIPGIGEPSLQEMEDLFLAELAKEDKSSGKAAGYPDSFPPEFKKQLDDFHQETLQMVEELITENLDTAILGVALEDAVEKAYVVRNPLNDRNVGEFGTFLEIAMFGTAGDSRPTSDIDTFRRELLPREKRVEVKAKIGTSNIDIGSITVYGLENLTALEKQTVRNITMIYKMMIKMQNMLYMALVEKTFASGRVGIGFRAMTLFTSLYLRGLLKIIGYVPKYSGTVQTKATAPKKDANGVTSHITYNLEMSLDEKTHDIFRGIERLSYIYLRHTDMIDEIHSGGISAREFFGRVKRLEGFLKLD